MLVLNNDFSSPNSFVTIMLNGERDLLEEYVAYINRQECCSRSEEEKQYDRSSESWNNNNNNTSSTSMESSSSSTTPSRNTVFPAMKLHPSTHSRRPSSSSSPLPLFLSSFSVPADRDDSPATTPFRFSGVPFSWEHVPGIPKKQACSSSSLKILPLPPTTTHQAPKKKPASNPKQTRTFSRDPFVAALVECSKEEADDEEEEEEEEDQYSKNNGFQWSAKVSRSVSDRFGFVNLYASSCKRSCAVSQSIIHVPRSMSRTSSNYDLISHRSRSR